MNLWGGNQPVVTRYALALGLKRAFTIVQLSDLHGETFGGRLTQMTKSLAPDLIVLTGDTLDSRAALSSELMGLLRELSGRCPVFAVAGNHERRLGGALSAELLRRAGVVMLENERFDGSVDGQEIHILGLSDPRQGVGWEDYRAARHGCFPHCDYGTALAALAAQDGIRLVLSHFPENFALIGVRSYGRYAFDVMLSGHAHGGSLRLPWLGGVYAPGQGVFPLFDAGLYRGVCPGGAALVVSRGLGGDCLRINNPPEVVLVTLR